MSSTDANSELLKRLEAFAYRLERSGFSPGIPGDLPLLRDAIAALRAAPPTTNNAEAQGATARDLPETAPKAELPAASAPSSTAAIGGDWPEDWKREGYNHAVRVAAEAVKYLAEHPRPSGGQERYNSEHLHQVADELQRTLAYMKSFAPSAIGRDLQDAKRYRFLKANRGAKVVELVFNSYHSDIYSTAMMGNVDAAIDKAIAATERGNES